MADMRSGPFALAMASVFVVAVFAQTQPPVIVSPDVLADRRVTFRIWAPKANEVQLSGDWMGATPPAALTRDDSGTWSVTLGYRLIWIGCGAQDIFFGGNKALAEKLRSAGIKHKFVEFSGGHAMPVFRRELVELLPQLFR